MNFDQQRWLESVFAQMFGVPEPQAADEPTPDLFTAFIAWRIRGERTLAVSAERRARAAVWLCFEWRVPPTPHSDHAHRALIDVGARVRPCCGLYLFLLDPLAKFKVGNPRLAARCPLCEVRP